MKCQLCMQNTFYLKLRQSLTGQQKNVARVYFTHCRQLVNIFFTTSVFVCYQADINFAAFVGCCYFIRNAQVDLFITFMITFMAISFAHFSLQKCMLCIFP